MYHNTSSVSEMLQELQWYTLEERRKRNRPSIFYKTHNRQTGINTIKYLTPWGVLVAILMRKLTRSRLHIQATTNFHIFLEQLESGMSYHLKRLIPLPSRHLYTTFKFIDGFYLSVFIYLFIVYWFITADRFARIIIFDGGELIADS